MSEIDKVLERMKVLEEDLRALRIQHENREFELTKYRTLSLRLMQLEIMKMLERGK